MTESKVPTRPMRIREGFLLTRDDSTKKWYDPGLQEMPLADADHEYTQAFLEVAPAPVLGDFEFAETKRRYANEKLAIYQAAEAAAREAEAAFTAITGIPHPGAPPEGNVVQAAGPDEEEGEPDEEEGETETEVDEHDEAQSAPPNSTKKKKRPKLQA